MGKAAKVQLHVMDAGVYVPEMAIDWLSPTPDNPRVFGKDDSKDPGLVELSKSIAVDGVVEPIIVRAHPSFAEASEGKPGAATRYEIRAGERRWRAAKLAGAKNVPCIVRVLDDKAAMRITLIENMERQNLSPIEEANGIASAVAKGFTYDEIAAETGRALSLIKRRAKLTDLCERWRKAVADPEHAVSKWPVSYLEMIARYPEATQIAMFKEFDVCGEFEYFTTDRRAFVRSLADFTRTLSLAPWKLDDAALAPKCGACNGCSKRSDCAAQSDLFDDNEFDEGAKSKKVKPGARCLDAACWDEKSKAHLKRAYAELVRDHQEVAVITDSYRNQKNADLGKMAVSRHHVTMGKKSDPGAVPALVGDGKAAGSVVWILPEKKGQRGSEVASKRGSNSGKKDVAQKTPLKERRAALELQRARIVVMALAEQLEEAIQKYFDPKKPVDTYLREVNQSVENVATAFVSVMGTGKHPLTYGVHKGAAATSKGRWEEFERRKSERSLPDLDADLFYMALRMLVEDLRKSVSDSNWSKKLDLAEAKNVCAMLSIDFEELRDQAAVEKPEPKSWALEAAGAKSEKKKKAAVEKLKGKGSQQSEVRSQKGKKKPKAAAKGMAEKKQPAKNDAFTKASEKKIETPGVCSTCGCTEDDPCVDRKNGECCAWANKKRTCCTGCTDAWNGRDVERPKDRAA